MRRIEKRLPIIAEFDCLKCGEGVIIFRLGDDISCCDYCKSYWNMIMEISEASYHGFLFKILPLCKREDEFTRDLPKKCKLGGKG